MKLGIDAYCSFGHISSSEEKFRLIKNAGFVATSLFWGDEDRHKQLELARKAGLEIDSIHADFGNPNALWQQGIDDEDYRDMLITSVKDCANYDIPVVAIHLTGTDPTPPPSEIGLKRIAELVEVAEQKNVKLAFENLWTFEHLDAVFEKFNSPNVGFCYDIGHENLNLHYDCLEKNGDRLFALHIQDNLADGQDLHLLPFDGTINWPAKMQQLKQCQPVEYFMLEVCYSRFSPDEHKKRDIYGDLSLEEFLSLAHERAVKLLNM